jgi:hypothetical protein
MSTSPGWLEQRRLALKMIGASVLALAVPSLGGPNGSAPVRAASAIDDEVEAEAIFHAAGNGLLCQLRLYREAALIRETWREAGDMTLSEFDDFFCRFQQGDTAL